MLVDEAVQIYKLIERAGLFVILENALEPKHDLPFESRPG